MDYTQSRGNVVELQCLSKFIEMGYECSIPYGNGAKYDFVADINGTLIKIQCKSAHNPISKDGTVDTGAFTFNTVSQTTNTKKTTRHKYTSDMIDYFATWFNGKVYIIPVNECSNSKTLRLVPPGNGQKKYNKAEDYEIQNYFTNNFEENVQLSITEKHYCIQCKQTLVSQEGGICSECRHLNQRTTKRPSREELKKLIRTQPFTQIASSYGVTDNAIRKWCDFEKLPRRKSDIKQISDLDWNKI